MCAMIAGEIGDVCSLQSGGSWRPSYRPNRRYEVNVTSPAPWRWTRGARLSQLLEIERGRPFRTLCSTTRQGRRACQSCHDDRLPLEGHRPHLLRSVQPGRMQEFHHRRLVWSYLSVRPLALNLQMESISIGAKMQHRIFDRQAV